MSGKTVFSTADILLPADADISSWAVIACDQFTSEPDYWRKAEEYRKGKRSTLDLVLPEAQLGNNTEHKVEFIHDQMKKYLEVGVFQRYPDCFIYTERVLRNGRIRRGIIGKIDLEQYDYTGTKDTSVRATERTVPERIPPRMKIRRGAPIELPHILLFCDDERKVLIEPLASRKNHMQKVYDSDLMLDGGHISGWLINGNLKSQLETSIREYEIYEVQKHRGQCLAYAVGDGNHSLASAKAYYEELKTVLPEKNVSTHPARYALCELNNIHDPGLVFEPIHRIIRHCEPEKILDTLKKYSVQKGISIDWVTDENIGTIQIPCREGQLPIAWLQTFLDEWLETNTGELDYIHDAESLHALCKEENSIGFFLPTIEKQNFFPGILSNGVMPRKAFSVGEARDKRYYCEAREIL